MILSLRALRLELSKVTTAHTPDSLLCAHTYDTVDRHLLEC